MENYPDHETYRKLYQRFYDGRSSRELIRFAGSIAGKTVLDLCGGDGRLSLEAIRLGAKSVWLIDQERRMVSDKAWSHPKILVLTDTVESKLKEFIKENKSFDFVFCQQAVNYWLNEESARLVASVLHRNGIFMFNTFNQKPLTKPQLKEYEIGNNNFVEVSWSVGDRIHHVQIREGLPCHATSFYWLSPDYLKKILKPYFSVAVRKEGRTSLYCCRRK